LTQKDRELICTPNKIDFKPKAHTKT